MEKWDACAGITADLDRMNAFGGWTFQTTDLSGVCPVFPADGWFDVLAWFWVPEKGQAAERRDRVPYASGYEMDTSRRRPAKRSTTIGSGRRSRSWENSTLSVASPSIAGTHAALNPD